MTDDVRARLDALYGRSPDSIWDSGDAMTEAILADPSLLVVAKPICETCLGNGEVPDAYQQDFIGCPDCDGAGYQPTAALPAKVVEEWAAVVRSGIAANGDDAFDDEDVDLIDVHWDAIAALSPEAVRLAQKTS